MKGLKPQSLRWSGGGGWVGEGPRPKGRLLPEASGFPRLTSSVQIHIHPDHKSLQGAFIPCTPEHTLHRYTFLCIGVSSHPSQCPSKTRLEGGDVPVAEPAGPNHGPQLFCIQQPENILKFKPDQAIVLLKTLTHFTSHCS